MQVQGRKTLVLGAGKSGTASARFLAERGATVALHDRRPVSEWTPAARELRDKYGVGLADGQLPSWLLDQIDLVVISPGVPTNSLPARYVDRKDGEVIGEVELAFRFMKGRIAAITGSNGKTTTTTLLGELLAAAGFKTFVGGNIGVPLIELAASTSEDAWTVAELSSFQLETIREFRPEVAICLNVTPNHLDRYDSFTDYAAAKRRIFMNQTPDDAAILNADDKITAEWANGLRASTTLFSVRRELEEGLFLRGDQLVSRCGGRERVLITRSELSVPGLHNVENVLAALAAGLACGADPAAMRKAAANFRGVEHRIEFVAEIAGVEFYNDSKATSVDATVKAVEALASETGKIVLILGGRGKGAPYAPLTQLLAKFARRLILIGEDAPNIERQLNSAGVPMTTCASMTDAVSQGFASAMAGDAVLLAPACASFDMFSGFEERGKVFKHCVAEIESQTDSRGAVQR